MNERTITLQFPDNNLLETLLGEYDQHLHKIEQAFPETIVTVRGNEVHLRGPDVKAAKNTFEELVSLAEEGKHLDSRTLFSTIEMVQSQQQPSRVLTHEILRSDRGRVIRPKSAGQKRYVEAIEKNVVTFGIGPAGTGKSWLAVATAVAALKNKLVERIILTRPAVEAGERLGFLPGDLMAKVDPYLRPLYDALGDMVGTDGVETLINNRTVEVAPLAFMRGRTLNSSFIILDEAQNTTADQMKMFLTRIGHGSKAVVTGDITQVDVTTRRSGLAGLEAVLGDIDGIGFVWLNKRDVVRHRIVQDIVDAYEKASESEQPNSGSS